MGIRRITFVGLQLSQKTVDIILKTTALSFTSAGTHLKIPHSVVHFAELRIEGLNGGFVGVTMLLMTDLRLLGLSLQAGQVLE